MKEINNEMVKILEQLGVIRLTELDQTVLDHYISEIAIMLDTDIDTAKWEVIKYFVSRGYIIVR